MVWYREELLVWLPSLVTYAIFTFTLAITISWFIKRQKMVALIEKIPGPKALPILGNALEVNVAPRELFQKITGSVGVTPQNMVRVWVGPRPRLMVGHCTHAEVILSSQKHIDKSRDYTFLHPWLGTGLLTSTGGKWFSRRKMLTPAFHFKILEDFVDVFNSQAATLVTKLQRKADGKPFDIFPFITLCTLDIICETAMGTNIHAQDNSESEYVKAVYRIGALVQQRQARPWLQPNLLFKLLGYAREHDNCLRILHNFSNSTIRARRQEYRQAQAAREASTEQEQEEAIIGKKKRLAFLDMLLEASEQTDLSDEDIREEVDTFMFEGHDTTAAGINWSIYLLGCHPEIQERVHEELDSIFGDSDRPATMADLREMKYTENCIKEALRIFPSVPFLARELKEEVVIDNYRIPVGTTVMVVVYRLHRDPKQFPNPELYDPDRFLPENVSKRHPYAYVPFSAGPRNCIGQKFALMEEKIVVSSVLRKFRVESTVRRDELKLLGELILRPEDGNMVKLHPRT